MTVMVIPAALSSSPAFERLGLLAYARYLKVLEQAAQRPAGAGVVSLPWADWLALLECNDSTLKDFFDAMQRAGLLTIGADQSVTVTKFAGLIPEPPAHFLFTEAQQVANWCALELSFPAWLLELPETQQLFRRWVATHVTREELEQAAQRAADKPDLSPSGLHKALADIRTERLERARNL